MQEREITLTVYREWQIEEGERVLSLSFVPQTDIAEQREQIRWKVVKK